MCKLEALRSALIRAACNPIADREYIDFWDRGAAEVRRIRTKKISKMAGSLTLGTIQSGMGGKISIGASGLHLEGTNIVQGDAVHPTIKLGSIPAAPLVIISQGGYPEFHLESEKSVGP